MDDGNSYYFIMETRNHLTRDEFNRFFRDDEKLNLLTVDDRIEIFSTVLAGSSDLSKELLDDILSDYCGESLRVIETCHDSK